MTEKKDLYSMLPEELTEYIACLGNSGGGTATYYSACLEERIKTAVPSCSVCSFDASIAAMEHCLCNYVPGIRKYFDMGEMGGLVAPRNLMLVAGIEDDGFPIDGVKKSYETIKELYSQTNGKCELLVGNQGHRFYPDIAWPLFDKWMEER